MTKLIVISGCSGGGKSTLLSELSHVGYAVVPEIGREVYKEFADIAADNPIFMCETIIERSVASYHQATIKTATLDEAVFFDRSFLECVSYYQSSKMADSHKYDHLIDELRYYPIILMTPPWKEIFVQDEERKHTFADAATEYARLLESYPKYGYEIVELPKVSVKERVQFLESTFGFG
jgi:predicted ATPase